MSLKGCLSAANHHLFKAGISYTEDCFIMNDVAYFRRLDTIFSASSNVVNFPPSPSLTEHLTSSYFSYNIITKKSSKINSVLFYKELLAYNNTEFKSKDLNDVIDKALEDSFVMFLWCKSQHMKVTNYEADTKEGGYRNS